MDFEKLKQLRNDGKEFINLVGLEIKEISDGYVVGELKLTKKHANPIGSIHGGCLYSVADTVGGVAATTKGSMVTTVNGNMNYLNAGKVGDTLKITGEVVKAGKKIIVADVRIYNQDGKLLTTSLMSYCTICKIDESVNLETYFSI